MGTVEILDVVPSEAPGSLSSGMEDSDAGSSTVFRLRFRTIWFDTVAAFNFVIASLKIDVPAWVQDFRFGGVVGDIEVALSIS